MRTSRIFTSLFMLSAFSWAVAACTAQESQTGTGEAAAETGGAEAGAADEGAEGAEGIQATVVTSKGEIHLKLAEKEAPLAVLNMVNLAERGYYNGLNFHRVIANFMIQGGCPDGNGRGGPGYKFDNEISPKMGHDGPGVLAMANAGPDTNGSQFYITHLAVNRLDGGYTVFGNVVGPEDQKVVDAIRQGDKIVTIKIAGDTTELKAAHKEQLDEWNAILDRKYPKK